MLYLEYIKILIFLVVSIVFISILIIISFLLNKDSALVNKKKPVECGSHLFGSGKNRLEINFFIVAIIFVVFEVELLVVVPWLLFFEDSSNFSLVWMLLFLFILTFGLLLEYINCNFKF